MQYVIGEFESLGEAARAVRLLEARNVSIQDMVIADRKQRTWRRVHPLRGTPRRQFPVLMIGDAPEIDRVRALVCEQPLSL